MDQIHLQYTYVKSEFEKLSDQINGDVESSDFQWSYKSLLRNTAKIDFILNGIIAASDNFYASQILSRCLFEHYLVGYYIWLKLKLERNDNIGKEYYQYYFSSEFFKQNNYDFSVEKIKENKKDNLTTIEKIIQKYPELSELEQSELDNVHKVSKQFDIRQIGSYLNNKIENTYNLQRLHLCMLDFLQKYNQLSSYVHGGPLSELQTFESYGGIDKQKLCVENINWGKIASRTSKENIIAAMAMENPLTYFPIFKKITQN